MKTAGCEKVIVDQVSGTVAQRPGLEKIKELLREGDTLVAWRLDRLGRSLRDLKRRYRFPVSLSSEKHPQCWQKRTP